jgi:hypothetical protein
MADTFPVEILAPGTFKGIAVTEAMLDEMTANFARLHPLGIKPPVRLGHGWDDTQPAAGWISGLRRVGAKLVADLSDVAPLVKRAIRARKLARCSAEFWTKFEHSDDEKNLKSGVRGAAVTGLALLGAVPPVVKNLADLETYLAEQPADAVHADVLTLSTDDPTVLDGAQATGAGAGDADASVAPSTLDRATVVAILSELIASGEWKPSTHPRTEPEQENPSMTDAEKQALVSELRTQLSEEQAAKDAKHADELKALETKLSEAETKREADLRKLSEENAAMRDRETAALAKAQRAEAVKFAEDALRKPRIFKAQLPIVTALYELLPDTVSVKADAAKAMGLAERDWSLRALFAECIEAYPTANVLKELATDEAPTGPDLTSGLKKVAADHQLDLSEPAQRQQAHAILAAQGASGIPDYTTPTARRDH